MQYEGETALHAACEHGHVDVATLLLHHGALVDSQDKVRLLYVSMLNMVCHSQDKSCIVFYSRTKLSSPTYMYTHTHTHTHIVSVMGFSSINYFVCFATTNILTFVCILQPPFRHSMVGQPLILLLRRTTLMWLKLFLLLVHSMG